LGPGKRVVMGDFKLGYEPIDGHGNIDVDN